MLRKEEKYASLILNLESRGFSVTYVPMEIGSLGHYTKSAIKKIQTFSLDI